MDTLPPFSASGLPLFTTDAATKPVPANRLTILVIGANGGIGAALVNILQQQMITSSKVNAALSCAVSPLLANPEPCFNLLTVSRTGTASSTHCVCQLTEPGGINVLKGFLANNTVPDVVFCCMGVLHSPTNSPEKALRNIQLDWLQHSMNVNVYAHIAAAQAIAPLLSSHKPIQWLSLSAMVGSITDNQLGGWYSYRMTKSALNMFIKNLSLEWQRKHKENMVVAVHPGTTDTSLSLPYQQGIDTNKLYSPTQTAQRLIAVWQSLRPTQQGKLLHWDGSTIPF